jgi:hypothetical protein
MPGKDLTPEDVEKLKRRILLKAEKYLRTQLRARRAQAHKDEMRARLHLVQGGKKAEEPGQ